MHLPSPGCYHEELQWSLQMDKVQEAGLLNVLLRFELTFSLGY